MIYKSRFGDGPIWNPSICECEYDKSCNMGEYLDYQNCESTKKLIDNLVEEDDEDINGFLFYWLKKNNISVQYISSATN